MTDNLYPQYPAPRPIPPVLGGVLRLLSIVLVVASLALAAYMVFVLPGQVAAAREDTPVRVYPAPPPWQPMACIVTKAGC